MKNPANLLGGKAFWIAVTLSWCAVFCEVRAARPTIVAWGNGQSGQTTVPASVTNAAAISAGHYFSLALKTDGTVVPWGDAFGQVPVPSAVSNVVAIASGEQHSLALRSDGTVIGWGSGPANVPGVVEKAVGGLAAGQTGSAVKATNQHHQSHEDKEHQLAGASQRQIV